MSKFDSNLDEYVYDLTLEGGCDEEAGSVDENGMWWGLMRGPFETPQSFDLDQEEIDLLTLQAGCMVSVDSQGFVYVQWFDTPEEMTAAWAEVEGCMDAYYKESSE